MLNHSGKLMNDTLKRLFDVDRSGPAVHYNVKPGMENEARATWATHGVCLKCRMRTITAGRCAECATRYSTPGGESKTNG